MIKKREPREPREQEWGFETFKQAILLSTVQEHGFGTEALPAEINFGNYQEKLLALHEKITRGHESGPVFLLLTLDKRKHAVNPDNELAGKMDFNNFLNISRQGIKKESNVALAGVLYGLENKPRNPYLELINQALQVFSVEGTMFLAQIHNDDTIESDSQIDLLLRGRRTRTFSPESTSRYLQTATLAVARSRSTEDLANGFFRLGDYEESLKKFVSDSGFAYYRGGVNGNLRRVLN